MCMILAKRSIHCPNLEPFEVPPFHHFNPFTNTYIHTIKCLADEISICTPVWIGFVWSETGNLLNDYVAHPQ